LHNNAARNSHSNVDYDISSSVERAALYTTGHLHTLKRAALVSRLPLSENNFHAAHTMPQPERDHHLFWMGYIGGEFLFPSQLLAAGLWCSDLRVILGARRLKLITFLCLD
jgi:hypothetical protein